MFGRLKEISNNSINGGFVMNIAKKVLLVGVIASGFAGNAALALSSKYMVGFNTALLKPFVVKSKKGIKAAEESFNKAICFNAKECAKRLYEQQKNALKVICMELKQTYRSAKLNGSATWFADKQLYKMYKKLVYKTWKKNGTFADF